MEATREQIEAAKLCSKISDIMRGHNTDTCMNALLGATAFVMDQIDAKPEAVLEALQRYVVHARNVRRAANES